MMKIIRAQDVFDETKNDKKEIFPYFYHPAFEKVTSICEQKQLIIVFDDKANSMVLKLWKNKFLNLIQPIFPPLSKNAVRLLPEEETSFLNKITAFVKEKKLGDRITQPENFAIFHSQPNSSTAAPFGTYFLDLGTKTEEELFTGLHSKHRNVIRNAERQGVTIKYGSVLIDDFYSLYKQTMHRSNMYCQSLSYFKEFYKQLPYNTLCGVAYYNEKPEGALFMPYTNFGAFYLYGASAEKTQINGSVNYLHWTTIKMFKTKGVKRYDFVEALLSDVSGTKLEGIHQFKERFGANLEKGLLWKKDINNLTCSLFDNLVTLKLRLKNQKVPLDIIDQEINKQGGR